MKRCLSLLVLTAGSLCLGIGNARAQDQHPIMDRVAQHIIEKYQTSTCASLAAQKKEPKTAEQKQMEQRLVEFLRSDPQMRTDFLNRVAGPIANKLFECGMIP